MLAALLLLAAPSLLAQGDDDGVTIELFTPGADETAAAAETTVGMGVDLVEFVIPGAEVRARPVKDAGRADVIVRIENVFAHGTDHRYNLEVTPLVEGVGEEITRDFKAFEWATLESWQKSCGWDPLTSNLLLVGQRGNTTPAFALQQGLGYHRLQRLRQH